MANNPAKAFEFIRLYPSLTADPVIGRIGEIYYNVTMNTLRMCIDDSPLTWQDINITPYLQNRLGIIDYQTYEDYTSLNTIAVADSYPEAISKLDSAINGILTDVAKEEKATVGIGGTTTFTAAVLEWSVDNAIPDIQVYVNGVRQLQDLEDNGGGDYKKTSDSTLLFYYNVPENAVILVRDERTGSGGGGGGGDLTNITVNPQPISNAAYSLGTVTKAWKALYIKDSVTSQVYKVEVISGVFQVTPVP